MYCCLKACFMASNLLDAGPAPKEDADELLALGLYDDIVGMPDDEAIEDPSSENPRPLQAPTSAAFFPLPCLNRDFLNQEL